MFKKEKEKDTRRKVIIKENRPVLSFRRLRNSAKESAYLTVCRREFQSLAEEVEKNSETKLVYIYI